MTWRRKEGWMRWKKLCAFSSSIPIRAGTSFCSNSSSRIQVSISIAAIGSATIFARGFSREKQCNNPGARGGLSGEVDFLSLLSVARGESETGEPVVSLTHISNIRNNVPYENLRWSVWWDFMSFGLLGIISLEERTKLTAKYLHTRNVKDWFIYLWKSNS